MQKANSSTAKYLVLDRAETRKERQITGNMHKIVISDTARTPTCWTCQIEAMKKKAASASVLPKSQMYCNVLHRKGVRGMEKKAARVGPPATRRAEAPPHVLCVDTTA
eukprot:TRINITY_DN13129_c0_g1_i4.p1 TRINITY_DN13129_c0_g1~~TRINITY_DN13129_c0_g1_i4.p1  ORF type:complete len:108 (-),score=3.98 TRINITY_DN13129_c0_g1_i4:4-327(-)